MRFFISVIRRLIVVLIFFSIAIAFLTHSLSIRHFFTADTLYIPSLFRDIFLEGGSLFDWHLPGAPYFFPDMGLFMLIQAIIGDTYFSALIYALCQVGITYTLVLLLISLLPIAKDRKNGKDGKYILGNRVDFFSIIFLLVIVFMATRSQYSELSDIRLSYIPYFRILTSVFHFGNIINTLVAIAAIIAILEKKNLSIGYAVLFLISVLGTSSDILFLVSCTAPSVVSIVLLSVIYKPNRLTILKIASCLFTGAAIGILVKYFLAVDATSGYILRQIDLIGQTKALGAIISLSFQDMPVPMVLVFSFYGIFLWKIKHLSKSRSKMASHFYLYTFIPISTIFSVITVVVNGILPVSHYGSSRYFLNLYWFPVLFSWLIVDIFSGPLSQSYRYLKPAFLLIVLGLSGYSSLPKGELRVAYYPPLVQCIDQALSAYTSRTSSQVQYGIASYSPVSLINEFSKLDLKIVQVLPDLAPIAWVNNVTRYRPRYDFAVVEKTASGQAIPDISQLNRLNGAPEYEVVCENTRVPAKVLVYGEGKLKTELFAATGDSVTWPACELPIGKSGIARESCSVTTQPEPSAGIVTFGPYVSLPKGRYRFNIQYSSPAASTQKVGNWDVLITSSKKAEWLQQGNLSGTDNQNTAVSGVFDVRSESAGGQVEVRTASNAASPLTIFAVTLSKVG